MRDGSRLSNLCLHFSVLLRRRSKSYWIGVVLATIGAGLILGALTFVSALIGVLVNAMIVLMLGPVIDRVAGRSGRAGSR